MDDAPQIKAATDAAETLVSKEILRVLRDPSARPRASGPEAHADDLLRGRVLERVARALSAAGVPGMLVKGAALALTVYPPGARRMGDVDLLVRRSDRARALQALERDGFLRHSQPDRPLSAALLGEAQLTVECGAISSVIEVHTSLDKIAPRLHYDRALWRRALPIPTKTQPSLASLLTPSPEDHAVLIALHSASHEFNHEIALLDTELLLRAGLDRRALEARALEAHAAPALFLLLAALRSLGAASVTGDLIAAFDPGPLRRRALARFYNIGAYPVARAPTRLGLPWILRQTPLRDDLAAWTAGVALYAALRLADRLADRALLASDAIGLSNSAERRARSSSRP